MARKSNPLGGSFLNRLSFFRSKPINSDARRLAEPSDPLRTKKAKPKVKKARRTSLQRSSKQPELTRPRKQVFKKDGAVVLVSDATHAEA